jgi:hypothetical protein
MTVLLASNAATTTLAAPLSPTGTTITVAPGTGQIFPSPATGQGFLITLTDIATQVEHEICLCTARTGDTLIVVRGQEGTLTRSWVTGDVVANLISAGLVNSYVIQPDTLQSNAYTYNVAAGSADAIVLSVPSMLTALTDGMSFSFRALYANTTTVPTLELELGSTATTPLLIVKGDNLNLLVGDIQPGMILNVVYNTVFNAWVMMNPITDVAGGSF